MADMKVSSAQSAQAVSETQSQKAENAVSKFVKAAKSALFGKTGAGILAGAAAGALLAGPAWPIGAAIGGTIGLGMAASSKAAESGKKGMSTANALLAGGLAGMAFGLPGLLVAGAGAAFATGAAQNAAKKVSETLGNLFHKPEPTPAPAQ